MYTAKSQANNRPIETNETAMESIKEMVMYTVVGDCMKLTMVRLYPIPSHAVLPAGGGNMNQK